VQNNTEKNVFNLEVIMADWLLQLLYDLQVLTPCISHFHCLMLSPLPSPCPLNKSLKFQGIFSVM
jgi:hypothetical protein